MTPEREREIRTLAAGLVASRRHARIGRVGDELLAELDETRDRLERARLAAEEYQDLYLEARTPGGTLA